MKYMRKVSVKWLVFMMTGLMLFVSCSGNNNNKDKAKMGNEEMTVLLMKTTAGDVKIALYNDTPKHRDNILKLVNDHFYDGLLFHRVIKDFMVQGGDPDSGKAPQGKMLGSGDVGYTVPAEFVYPKHYHRKGALAAARQGDNVNPDKESSGCQFYIVTGKVYSETELLDLESQLNGNKLNKAFNAIAMKRLDEIRKYQQEGNQDALYDLQEEIYAQAEKEAAAMPDVKFTPQQIKDYTTVGGTPFLDNEYTVFGEVIDGMEVIDRIQQVATDRNDRPKEDVRIVEMIVID